MAYCPGAAPEENPRDGITAASVELLEVEDDEVRALALLERADFGVDAQHLRALAGREPHRVVAAQGSDPADHPREKRRQADLLESVEPVVAGRAVRAETDRDARTTESRDLRDARAELELRRRAVRNRGLRRLEDFDPRLIELDSVRDDRPLSRATRVQQVLRGRA